MNARAGICILLLSVFLFAPTVELKGASIGSIVRKERKKLQKRYNENRSGVGDIKVEKRMVRFLAREARRAKTKGRQKKYKRLLVKSLAAIRKMKRRRDTYSLRGRWAVTVRYPTAEIELIYHFDYHNSKTDFVRCEELNSEGDVIDTFSGYQRFSTFKGNDTDLYFGTLILERFALLFGPKKPDHPSITGSIRRTIDGEVSYLTLTGRRYASPFP